MNHNDIVRQSFKKQAEKFVAYHMSKVEYTDYLIQKIAATGEEHALEVAAGTCICGRALAPYVKDITCLDMTEEMLGEDFYRWLYTAITRATERLYLVNLPDDFVE